MDACIRAAGTPDADILSGDGLPCFFDNLLHSPLLRLGLPAAEVGAVVGDRDFEGGHWTIQIFDCRFYSCNQLSSIGEGAGSTKNSVTGPFTTTAL